MSKLWESWSLIKFQMDPKPRFLTSSLSKKKEHWQVDLRVAKASHAHKTWPGVSHPAPHLLHKGLPDQLHYVDVSSQDVMSNTEANNKPGFYPVKDSRLVLAVRLGHEISFLARLLSPLKIRHISMRWLSIQIKIFFLFFCLETSSAGFGPKKLVNNSLPCESIGNFIFACPGMSGYQKRSHRMLGGNFVQRLLALLHLWGRCFGNLKTFQNRLTFRTNTNVSLWSSIHLNFISTDKDSIYLGLESCSTFS